MTRSFVTLLVLALALGSTSSRTSKPAPGPATSSPGQVEADTGNACVLDTRFVGTPSPIPGSVSWNLTGDPPPGEPSTRRFWFQPQVADTTLGGAELTEGESYQIRVTGIDQSTRNVTIYDSSNHPVTQPGGLPPAFTTWNGTGTSPVSGFTIFLTQVDPGEETVRVFAALNGKGVYLDWDSTASPTPVTGKQLLLDLDPLGTDPTMPRARLAFDFDGSPAGYTRKVFIEANSVALDIGGGSAAAGETYQVTGTNLGSGATDPIGATGLNLDTGAVKPSLVNTSDTATGWPSDFTVLVTAGSSGDEATIHMVEGDRAVAFDVSE